MNSETRHKEEAERLRIGLAEWQTASEADCKRICAEDRRQYDAWFKETE